MCREGWSAGGAAVGTQIVTLAGFAAGLAVTLGASELLVRGLARLGARAGLSEGLLGLLGALGADSPELSSAVIAILAGAGSVGVGVILGSNLFNLAALLGVSAIVARGVRMERGPLIRDAAAGLFLIAMAALMAVGGVGPPVVAGIVVPVSAVYVFGLAVPRGNLERTASHPGLAQGSWTPVLLLPIALAGVVGGSFVMVHEALDAQGWLHLSNAVLGTLVLAALTSLPNLWVALHFARSDRGTALFSAAMNSNSINLLGGLIVPALFFGAASEHASIADFGWLAILTLVAVIAPLTRSRLTPLAGGAIIAIYLVFVGLRIAGI